jgi:hypothetical protein
MLMSMIKEALITTNLVLLVLDCTKSRVWTSCAVAAIVVSNIFDPLRKLL